MILFSVFKGVSFSSLHILNVKVNFTHREKTFLYFPIDINRDHANAAASLIQLKWRIVSSTRKKFFSKFEHDRQLNQLHQKFTTAWVQWVS